MNPKISPLAERLAIKECGSVASAQERYGGCCIDFAGELTDATPGARLAYFDNISHPAWRYHAAMQLDGWIHDLWYPMMPLDTFMAAIGAPTVEYPAEDNKG